MTEISLGLKKPKTYLLHTTLLTLVLAVVFPFALSLVANNMAILFAFFAIGLASAFTVVLKCLYVHSMWKDGQYGAAEVASATAKDGVRILAIVLTACLLIGIVITVAIAA